MYVSRRNTMMGTQTMTDNGFIDHLRAVKEEGAKAKRDGKGSWDNPYSFITETHEAYAWDDGFKRAEAA